jgi:NADH-quinone oxidoreductase subunit G
MVNIEIDGKKIQARNGSMVIEAADANGIRIPRFCYHKKLSIAANCRMCLVEVERAAKPLPACATPVTEGMKVYTKSPKALIAQKAVMEFLLINHPLDCPICDQGGECELQDVSMGYGGDLSRYTEKKRVVKDKNLGPLIMTDMTRCIHCTRCVRFGEEIAGIKELGATGRGEHMQIGTYIEKAVCSELSGNVIDLCPVGALTSKPFRYSARAWELRQQESIAPHDCIGSNIYLHIKQNRVMRAVPRENEQINETWISDRDRFGYEGLNSEERLRTPMVKRNGQWQETDWETALETVVNGINKIINEHGASQLGALASPMSTVEELYLVQKVMRALGSHNIDHRLRQQDFRHQDIAPVFPWLGQSLAELDSIDAALLIGSNVRKDQPIAGHRLRKAALAGANIMFVNPVDYEFLFPVANKLIVDPRQIGLALAGVAKALLAATKATPPKGLDVLLNDVDCNETHESIARHLMDANQGTVLLGMSAFMHPDFSTLRALVGLIAELSHCRLGYLPDGANAAGAWLAGAVPHRDAAGKTSSGTGMNIQQMFNSPLKGYILSALEPDQDCADPLKAIKALQSAEFVVSLTMFDSESLRQVADVMLPIAPFTETSGTFVNVEGRWQSFQGVVEPQGDARPAWKIWRVLGNLFNLRGFDYVTSEEVRDELHNLTGEVKPRNSLAWRCPDALQSTLSGVVCIADVPIYSVDPLVRRADALQHTADAQSRVIYIGQALATKIGLADAEQAVVKQGEERVMLPVVIDYRLSGDSVLIPAVKNSPGVAFTNVELERAQ